MKQVSNPKIDVLIPTYNNAKYLKECLNSILQQTYANISVIVIDDGSTDNTEQVIKEIASKDSRVEYHKQRNSGVSKARNKALAYSKSDYVLFVDGDDKIDKNHITHLYRTLRKYDADVAISALRVKYRNEIKDHSADVEGIISNEEYHKDTLYGRYFDVTPCCKLYKKKLFKEYKYPENQLFEDTALTNIVVDQAKTIAVDMKATYSYVIRDNSITTVDFDGKKLDLIKSTKNMTDYLLQKYPSLKKACTRRMAFSYLSTLAQLANSQKQEKELAKSLRENALKYGKASFFDSRTPIRDKIAILTLIPGFNFYKNIWSAYKNLTKRKI